MRVIYVIKALQIIVAALVLVRLINVGKFCENRQVTDLSLHDAEKSVMTAEPDRQRRMSVILTKKDQSLEEVHEESLRRRKGQLNVMEQPDLMSTSKTSPASKSNQHEANAHPIVLKAETFPANKIYATDGHKVTAEVPNEHVPAKRDLKGVKEEKVEKIHKKEETTEKIKDEGASPEQHSQNELVDKVTAKIITATKTEKPTSRQSKRLALKLENTVTNCLAISSTDILGFGEINLAEKVAFRIIIACLLVSIFGMTLSILHNYTSLAPPPKCRVFIESICQIALWGACGFLLFLVRQEWEKEWNNASGGTFEPDYPGSWYCSELMCYIMIVVFLLESFCYDYAFYKIYVEESLGNYTVVDRPDYYNSIYGTTLETTEDNAL